LCFVWVEMKGTNSPECGLTIFSRLAHYLFRKSEKREAPTLFEVSEWLSSPIKSLDGSLTP
jgi:hypothetical protein